MTDFAYNHIKTVRDGERKPKLRPGQVSLHNGDARTEVYDLSGFGPRAVNDWKVWATVTFDSDQIEGDYPNFYLVR